MAVKPDRREAALREVMAGFFDPAYYRLRYPDVVAADLDPLLHFIRVGAAERRDPNRFFDSAWYLDRYPDVASGGFNPLLHYLQAGAAELRNPHPEFDAVYYARQHPEAAANPMVFHVQIGQARGYLTERRFDVRDYLPSVLEPAQLASRVFTDVVIRVRHGCPEARRCVGSVLADRAFPLARIIVVDDRCGDKALVSWLRTLADDGHIHLIRNQVALGFAKCANQGILAAEDHDVVVLDCASEVSSGWLRRLTAQAYAQPDIGVVVPFSSGASVYGYPVAAGQSASAVDAVCARVNAGRWADIPVASGPCVYIRRDALRRVGMLAEGEDPLGDFCRRASVAGWRHLVACDVFVAGAASVGAGAELAPDSDTVDAYRFAVTGRLFRDSGLPVILMVSHGMGGGVRHHITSLMRRHTDAARFLLLESSRSGAVLTVPALAGHPSLTLPAGRLDDLIAILASMNVSRVHIHHLLGMDMDIRVLIQRMRLPFDVTVHDYFPICPQVNLLTWPEGLYCGEPGPAGCNACIAGQNSHGASDITAWRHGFAWLFMDADRVICPSQDVKLRLDRHGFGQRAIVAPHEPQPDPTWRVRVPGYDGGTLRIVLLGVLANHKGARLVAELLEAAPPDLIEVHLIGHVEDSFPVSAAKLLRQTGPYDEKDLPALLQAVKPHVIWFPATWPETYSYTMSTALAFGAPIVASDLGALTERLMGRPFTWLVDHRAAACVWLQTFEAVRSALRKGRRQVTAPRVADAGDFYASGYLDVNAKRDAQAGGRPRICVVPERLEGGGLAHRAFVRLLQPLDHCQIRGAFDVILADPAMALDYQADIIVTQGLAIPNTDIADRLTQHARRIGATLVYDLDDDLLDSPHLAQMQARTEAARRMLAVADEVWVASSGLRSGRSDAVVVGDRLDERIWITAPAPVRPWDDPVRILCMGTSRQDLAMIEPALERLMAGYGERIAIDIMGMVDTAGLPEGLRVIKPPFQATRSYPGFVNWLTHVRPRWHIGLAPLLDGGGKSAVRALEYAALGMAVLASDVAAYRGSLADGPGGQLVANTPQAWYAALDWLIRNQDLRRSLGAGGRAALLEGGTLASQPNPWVGLLARRALAAQGGLPQALEALTMQHDQVGPIIRKRRHSSRG